MADKKPSGIDTERDDITRSSVYAGQTPPAGPVEEGMRDHQQRDDDNISQYVTGNPTDRWLAHDPSFGSTSPYPYETAETQSQRGYPREASRIRESGDRAHPPQGPRERDELADRDEVENKDEDRGEL